MHAGARGRLRLEDLYCPASAELAAPDALPRSRYKAVHNRQRGTLLLQGYEPLVRSKCGTRFVFSNVGEFVNVARVKGGVTCIGTGVAQRNKTLVPFVVNSNEMREQVTSALYEVS
jgi:hypothetical protein